MRNQYEVVKAFLDGKMLRLWLLTLNLKEIRTVTQKWFSLETWKDFLKCIHEKRSK